jgi:hypothetical protein
LDKLILKDSLCAMARDGVRDFVTENGCQPILGLGHRKDAGVNDHFPSGQAEGIDLLAIDEADPPIEILGGLAGLGRNARSDPLNRFGFRSALDDIGGGEDLLKGLKAKRFLLGGRKGDPLGPSGFGIRESFGGEKLKEDKNSGNDKWSQLQCCSSP